MGASAGGAAGPGWVKAETLDESVLEHYGRSRNVCLYNSCVITAEFTHPKHTQHPSPAPSTAQQHLEEIPKPETPSAHRWKNKNVIQAHLKRNAEMLMAAGSDKHRQPGRLSPAAQTQTCAEKAGAKWSREDGQGSIPLVERQTAGLQSVFWVVYYNANRLQTTS